MSPYNRRVIGIVVAPLVTGVETAICALLGPDYRGCLSVPLSPTGEEPATHFGGSAQLTEEQRDAVAVMMRPDFGICGFRGLALGLETADDVPYVATWPELPEGPPDEWRWDFDAAAASLGLRRVMPPAPADAVDDTEAAVDPVEQSAADRSADEPMTRGFS